MNTTSLSRLPWIISLALLALPLASRPASACLWDYDTLMMERRRFPDALELITGKFLRHSPELYRWRIEDRRRRLEENPYDLSLYDDLGVAYDKLGEHEKAIEMMLTKEELQSGLYETYANLGTFYIHAGQLEKGLEFIKRAIETNPDAHFGREIYQQHLVEYVLSKKVDGKLTLPLRGEGNSGFERFPGLVGGPKGRKGVLGMMRFGHFDSPVLLEVLGDLMEEGQLKARAYLKASYEVDDPEAKSAYRHLAGLSLVLSGQTTAPVAGGRMTLQDVERSFQSELAEAAEWYSSVREHEIRWIREGKNPDEEFAARYYERPAVSHSGYDVLMTVLSFGGELHGMAFALVWLSIAGVTLRLVWLGVKRRRRAADPQVESGADSPGP